MAAIDRLRYLLVGLLLIDQTDWSGHPSYITAEDGLKAERQPIRRLLPDTRRLANGRCGRSAVFCLQ
jgi:hypothetical protein